MKIFWHRVGGEEKLLFYHLLKMSERISDLCIPPTLQALPCSSGRGKMMGLGHGLTQNCSIPALLLWRAEQIKGKLVDGDKGELEASGSCIQPAIQSQHRLTHRWRQTPRISYLWPAGHSQGVLCLSGWLLSLSRGSSTSGAWEAAGTECK